MHLNGSHSPGGAIWLHKHDENKVGRCVQNKTFVYCTTFFGPPCTSLQTY